MNLKLKMFLCGKISVSRKTLTRLPVNQYEFAILFSMVIKYIILTFCSGRNNNTLKKLAILEN